jgi:hypothetical protein
MSLTKEQVMIEYVKCMKDTPYALKTYLQLMIIRFQSMFHWNYFLTKYHYLNDYENFNENIALKYRQAGVSTVTAAWISKKLPLLKKQT